MERDVKIGTISWIDSQPNPTWTSAQAKFLEPDWIPKTYLGLAATSNGTPPKTLADFPAYEDDKDFRALMFCHFRIEADDSTGAITKFSVIRAIHDPGWTPFFKLRQWPLSGFSFDEDILLNWKPYAGEASPISVVRTQARHPNSVITEVPKDETVLVDGLIKFRAGSHTDQIGVNNVHSPYHVPWVWCEMILTYKRGALKLYGAGSIFPSHAWYLDDTQVASQAQVGDYTYPTEYGEKSVSMWPMYPGVIRVPTTVTDSVISVYKLRIFPVLSAGAPAGGAQSALSAEKALTGPVDLHPYTVSGGATVTN